MSSKKWFRRTFGALLACASVVSFTAVGGPATGVVSAQTAVDAGGEFHALPPQRILDTRPTENINDVAPLGAKQAGVGGGASITDGEFDFSPLGLGGLPEDRSDILAVVATITVLDATQVGYLAAYPKGFEFGGPDGNGEVSALTTFEPNRVIPNLAIVGIGEDDKITFNLNMPLPGTANVIVDVFGFISTSQYDTAGARLEIVTPGRILDTRTSPNPRPGQNLGLNDGFALKIRGATAVEPTVPNIVPDDPDVTAVVVNLALVNAQPNSLDTFVSVTPTALSADADRTASSFAHKGEVKANMAIVPIGPDGNIHIFNRQGDLDLVVDVLGYFKGNADVATNRGRVVPLSAPFRALDTREADFGDAPLGHASKEQWSFEKFAESVTLNPGAANEQKGPKQQGFIGDLFAVGLEKLYPEDSDEAGSFLQLTPGGLDKPPLSANVNFKLAQAVPNMSLIKYGPNDDGSDQHIVEAFNAYGSVDYVMDVYAIVLDD